jgi:hypothetical protein
MQDPIFQSCRIHGCRWRCGESLCFNRPSGIVTYHSNLKADLDFWYKPSFVKDHTFLKIIGVTTITTNLKIILGLEAKVRNPGAF